ncbi:MAG TPA: RNA polymerase sigma factor, partial [Chitinophagaceae bacterium]|nr:RNA polymerase sigma factor [Chitinophagaceae bacterium]
CILTEKEFLSEVRQHQGIIYKLVLLYAADEEEKKDMYQEILLQAWKSLHSFKGASKFSTWLYRLCINTLLTQKRKKTLVDYTDSLNVYEHATETSMLADRAGSLRWAIRKLPEIERAIVSMHLEGYENSEIAAMTGISNNNVAVKLHRSKQRLQELLKREA